VILAVQDTTSLNYTAHPATENLGPIGYRKDRGLGLLLHNTTASFSLKELCFGSSFFAVRDIGNMVAARVVFHNFYRPLHRKSAERQDSRDEPLSLRQSESWSFF